MKPVQRSQLSKLWMFGALTLVLGASALGCERPLPTETSTPSKPSQPQATEGKVAEPKPASGAESPVPVSVRQADYAITKLYLDKAESLLESEVGPDAARARARLSVYRADCEGALSHLASSASRKARGAEELFELATGCVGATAGAKVVENQKDGVWLRIQDEADLVLVPLVTQVAVRAREALERDLGETLPRPLRIDLVRDLFSLSAVSGLPVDSAETTGTVAIARWGRVTMVSPRAMSRGFPWADTLAHEITHLLLSRATADRAPLWLQEGVAKREERRWREAQAFDEIPNFSLEAFKAQVAGKSVGVDAIGPSIAMLPSAEAASIAFSEVTSYMDYWIEENGPHSLAFLLRELEVAPDPEAAMRGVSGYGVGEWQLIWRRSLEEKFGQPELSGEKEPSERLGPRALSRVLRLIELLTVEGFSDAAAEIGAPELDRAAHSAAYRFLLGRAAKLEEREDAAFLLGQLADVEDPHAGWLALFASTNWTGTSNPEAERIFAQAVGLDPLLPEVACRGKILVGNETTGGSGVSSLSGAAQDLCSHSRSLPVRGAR